VEAGCARWGRLGVDVLVVVAGRRFGLGWGWGYVVGAAVVVGEVVGVGVGVSWIDYACVLVAGVECSRYY